MARDISNSDDIIDSRDVIARIEELEADRDDWDEKHPATWSSEFPEEAEELRILKSLQEDAEGYASDWHYGETLIRESYFETYAQELADDLYGHEAPDHWPFTCIDWEKAARELAMDYTHVDFDGVTYLVRCG